MTSSGRRRERRRTPWSLVTVDFLGLIRYDEQSTILRNGGKIEFDIAKWREELWREELWREMAGDEAASTPNL